MMINKIPIVSICIKDFTAAIEKDRTYMLKIFSVTMNNNSPTRRAINSINSEPRESTRLACT